MKWWKWRRLWRDLLYDESHTEIKHYANETYRHCLTAQTAQQHLSSLLALIHEDNTEYEKQHGTDKALTDAQAKMQELLSMRDSYKARAIWGRQ